MAAAWRIDRVKNDSSALRLFDGFVQIRINGTRAVEVYAACEHHDFTTGPGWVRLPSLEQFLYGKIWACRARGITEGQAQRFCSGAMVLRQVLHRLDGAIAHISDGDESRWRLLRDECPC